MGISQEDQKKLTQTLENLTKSSRLISYDKDMGGIGLGLMICHSLIKQNNGELSFFSEGLNKGSTFMFTMEMDHIQDG